MNFLAHLYLSGTDTKLLAGNFMGDFVKGKRALEPFDAGVVAGIKLHRAIDAYTDSHAVVKQSKDRLRPTYRHYSGVIVDVFYDHFLASQWTRYHHQPLEEFAVWAYQVIESYGAIQPEEVKHMMPYMIRGNWLVSYATIDGVSRALTGMARRTTYDSRMDQAVKELQLYYEGFKNEFQVFFPELAAHCRKWIAENQARA